MLLEVGWRQSRASASALQRAVTGAAQPDKRMSYVVAMVILMAIALATALSVLAAIAAAIEVLPRPASAVDPTDGDERGGQQTDAHVSPV